MDGESLTLDADFGDIDAEIARVSKDLVDFGQIASESVQEASVKATSAIDSIKKAGQSFSDVMATDVSAMVKKPFVDMLTAARGGASGMMDSVSAAAESFKAEFTKLFPTVSAGFKSMQASAETSLEGIRAAADAMWASITGGLTLVTGGIVSGFSAIVSPVSAAFGAIKSAASSVAGWVSSAFSKAFSGIKDLFSGAYGLVQELLPLAGVGLFAGLSTGLKALQEDEDAFQRVAAAVKATGGVAGFTSEQLNKMSDELSATTRFGGDAASMAQAAALQFKNVRGDELVRTLQTGADAAVAWGQDLTSATEKVARALDDPLEGFRLLKSEGVKFSAEQKGMIESMVRMGDVAGAQRVILDALAGSVGGQAAADVKTFSGMIFQVNEAMTDAWKSIASGLLPVLEPLVGWFREGASRLEAWGPVLKSLVNDFVEWANSSSGVMADWATKAQEYFMTAFDFAVDVATRAFTFVETAIKNFPLFMEAATAKFKLYWEQIRQFVTQTWESVSVTIQNIWSDMIDGISAKFQKWTDWLATRIANLPGFADWYGVSQEDLNETLAEMQGMNSKFASGARATAKGASDEDKKRLADLQAVADAAGAAFGDKFGENLEKNQAMVDAFKQRVQELLGLSADEIDLTANDTGEERTLNKEAGEDKDSGGGGGGGGFVGLEELAKKIQGAAAQKSDEAKALDKQYSLLVMQHNDTKAHQQKVEAKLDKQNELAAKPKDNVAVVDE